MTLYRCPDRVSLYTRRFPISTPHRTLVSKRTRHREIDGPPPRPSLDREVAAPTTHTRRADTHKDRRPLQRLNAMPRSIQPLAMLHIQVREYLVPSPMVQDAHKIPHHKRKMEEINFGRVYMDFGSPRGFRVCQKVDTIKGRPGYQLPGPSYISSGRLE